ncbi:unnamed protein product [Rotaria magnacalcarata]|nr:unnamed protein product [Rotaria magnacalcarata]
MLTWIQDSTLWVVMNAIGKGFGDYKGGIYDEPTCPKTDGNHAMQVVGYGVEGSKRYWLCKNSWGEQWGEKGYIRMKRGENMCGIANAVVQVAYKKAIDTTELYTTSTTQSHATSDTQLYIINPIFVILLLMLMISQNIAVYF